MQTGHGFGDLRQTPMLLLGVVLRVVGFLMDILYTLDYISIIFYEVVWSHEVNSFPSYVLSSK